VRDAGGAGFDQAQAGTKYTEPAHG
jgi:hypothetical protein